MAPSPTPPTIADILGGKPLNISITGSLPGEQLITAIITYASQARATMDPALLKRFDAVTVQQIEDLQSVWRSIWVALGVVK